MRAVRKVVITCGAAMAVACGGLVAPHVDADDYGAGGTASAVRDAGDAAARATDGGVAHAEAGMIDAARPDASDASPTGPVTYGGTVLYETGTIIGFTVSPTDVYVLDHLKHAIVTVPKNGAAPFVFSVRPPSTYFSDIAIDASRVYWTYGSGLGKSENAIESMPLAGGDVTTIAKGDYFTSIAVDATGIYWTNETAVMKADFDGSNARAIVPARPRPVEVNVRGALVCWTEDAGGFPMEVFCSGLEGENVTKVFGDGGWVQGCALDENGVFSIEQMPTSGGPNPHFIRSVTLPAVLANAGAGAIGGGRARRVAFDDGAFYIGWPDGAAKFPRGATSIDVTPASGIWSNRYGLDIAVDETSLYFVVYEGVDTTLRVATK
jgi:hypothetical protein